MSKIILKRDLNIHNYINKLKLKYFDDPDYKYYFLRQFIRLRNPPVNDMGWLSDDFYILIVDDEGISHKIGFISVDLRHDDRIISSIQVLIEKPYLSCGYGAKAMMELVKYYLIDRNFHKVEFSCVKDNEKSLKLYRKYINIFGREVGMKRETARLHDGKYVDMVLFEILRSDIFDKREEYEELREKYDF